MKPATGESAAAPPIVTFTTDFGTGSPYVAALKAVLLRDCPSAVMVDVSHAVPAFNLRAAGFVLWAGTRHFGPGSVHLAVVDPGVGTSRSALALEAGDKYYVGPDNGIFELILEHAGPWTAVAVPRAADASRTFEGRDVFAPVAAALASGAGLKELGEPLSNLVRLPYQGDSVVWIDAFGNLVTSLKPPLKGLIVGGHRVTATADTYGEAKPGQPFWYLGSMGYVEVAVPSRSADEVLGAGLGSPVERLG